MWTSGTRPFAQIRRLSARHLHGVCVCVCVRVRERERERERESFISVYILKNSLYSGLISKKCTRAVTFFFLVENLCQLDLRGNMGGLLTAGTIFFSSCDTAPLLDLHEGKVPHV